MTGIVDLSKVCEFRRGAFLISTDRKRLSVSMIHTFLTNCYWANGISKEIVERSIDNSLCFGVYDEFSGVVSEARPVAHGESQQGSQVGFARVVTDFATVAYLGDVFVLESHRGQGLGGWLMECIAQHPGLQHLRRWILLTRDAHGLYLKHGFTGLQKPERYMERHNPNVYQPT